MDSTDARVEADTAGAPARGQSWQIQRPDLHSHQEPRTRTQPGSPRRTKLDRYQRWTPKVGATPRARRMPPGAPGAKPAVQHYRGWAGGRSLRRWRHLAGRALELISPGLGRRVDGKRHGSRSARPVPASRAWCLRSRLLDLPVGSRRPGVPPPDRRWITATPAAWHPAPIAKSVRTRWRRVEARGRQSV
jgi:hypothetical protein